MLFDHPASRRFARRVLALSLPTLLLAPFLMTLLASPAAAVPLCAPKKGETGCVSGTVGSRANPVEGAEVVLTAPDGTEQSQTTEADGKYAFEITENGEYFLKLDDESLGEDLEQVDPPPDSPVQTARSR